jgi:hypothetical protein
MRGSGLVLGGQVMVIMGFVFVAAHLAVQLVSQLINGGIEIGVRAFSKQVATLDVHIALGSLAKFFFFHVVNGQKYFDVYHLVKVPRDAI